MSGPRSYVAGRSQLSQGEYRIRPIRESLLKAAQRGAAATRLLVKIFLYEPPRERGRSGRYEAWPGMRWKHDVSTVEQGQHFADALDSFVAAYQRDPDAVRIQLHRLLQEIPATEAVAP